jgi:hypothetical protein
VDVGNGTSATITGLVDGLTYYFAPTAYAGSLTSPYSKEVSGKIGSSGGDTGTGGTGVVAAYGFEENDGNNTASDASGNGHDGTLSNVVRTNQAKFGRALSFYGRTACSRSTTALLSISPPA